MCIALYITLNTGPPNKVSDWNVETNASIAAIFEPCRASQWQRATQIYKVQDLKGGPLHDRIRWWICWWNMVQGLIPCVNLFIHCHIASAHLFVCLCWSRHIASSRVIAIDPTRASWDSRLMLKPRPHTDSISISWTSQDSKWMQPETEAEELSGHRIKIEKTTEIRWSWLTITYSDAVMRLLS